MVSRGLILGSFLIFGGCATKKMIKATVPDELPATRADLQRWFGPIYAYDFATERNIKDLEKRIDELELKLSKVAGNE
jgi:hypothetical protein